MQSKALGPWPAGMTNATSPTRIPAAPTKQSVGALLDVLNCDVDRAGSVSRRAGWVVSDATPAHSLFEHNGATYGVVGTTLGRLDGGFTALATVAGRVAWTVLNGEPLYVDADGLWLIRSGAVEALPAGDTTDDEAELLLSPLPGGSACAYWQGRVLVARGNSLLWSEPLRYGLYNPLENFIQFEERVSWLAPLASGLYVGLRSSVRFLAGQNPAEFRQTTVAGRSWARGGATLDASGMDPQMTGGADEIAAWFGERGFALGLPDGRVQYPQADRLKDLPLGAGRLVVLGDRITVLSN